MYFYHKYFSFTFLYATVHKSIFIQYQIILIRFIHAKEKVSIVKGGLITKKISSSVKKDFLQKEKEGKRKREEEKEKRER